MRGATRTLLAAVAVIALAAPRISPAQTVPDPSLFDTEDAARVLEVAKQKLRQTAAVTTTTAYPKATRSDGTWVTIPNTDLRNWTQGFFPGLLWMMFQATNDPSWRVGADAWTSNLELQKTNTQTHDLGFKFYNSFGLAYRLTAHPYYRSVLLTAAESLATRYRPVAQVLSAGDWNPDWKLPLVVDTMMNLELLFWAAENGGRPELRDIAIHHAVKTMTDLVRPDGSTYHVVDYDPATGAIRFKGTYQGYSNESTWSRGQAWAIYGFTMAYRYTRDPRFLETARRTADYYLNNLPSDWIPNWDFKAPSQAKDSSAAAAVASALLELSGFAAATDPAAGARYRDAALRMLEVLASPSYLNAGNPSMSILAHGVGFLPANQEVNVGLIYGDFYFIEAVLRFLGLTPSQAISFGATWRYDDRGVDPGPDWMAVGFNDSAWRSGPAQLGYGDGDEATVLTRTSPVQPSVYFRRTFTVSGPVTQGYLTVLHDDGVAVWINGTRVFGEYVADPASHSAYASAPSRENEVSTTVLNPSLFTAGDNVVAVMVKQSDVASSDLSFDLALTLTTGQAPVPPPPPPPPGPVTTKPIPFRSIWKYDDSGVDRGTAWLALSYDDSQWRSGAGQLGYGDGDEATVLRHTPVVPTYYFRKRIRIDGTVTSAQLRALFDDGVAVWINGRQVLSRNMGRGTGYSALASATSAENQVAGGSLDLANNPFVPGDNIVTVMVKQSGLWSSDLSMDLELTVTTVK